MTQSQVRDLIACPSCGEYNVQGADVCEHCLSDLTSAGMPSTEVPGIDSDLSTPISNVRMSKPLVMAPATPVRDAVAAMHDDPSGAVVIADASGILGVFTERDVLKKVAGHNDAFDRPISDYMTPDPVVLRDDDTMATALHKMGSGGFRHIPLTRDGELVAMMTARDALGWLMGRYFD